MDVNKIIAESLQEVIGESKIEKKVATEEKKETVAEKKAEAAEEKTETVAEKKAEIAEEKKEEAEEKKEEEEKHSGAKAAAISAGLGATLLRKTLVAKTKKMKK